jgi:hypothetical protein
MLHERLGDRPMGFLQVIDALSQNLDGAAGHGELVLPERHLRGNVMFILLSMRCQGLISRRANPK